MTTLTHVIVILGHLGWFYVGYKIGKNQSLKK
jgi:uncharacterized membrane protein YuzA (DUF378 family)